MSTVTLLEDIALNEDTVSIIPKGTNIDPELPKIFEEIEAQLDMISEDVEFDFGTLLTELDIKLPKGNKKQKFEFSDELEEPEPELEPVDPDAPQKGVVGSSKDVEDKRVASDDEVAAAGLGDKKESEEAEEGEKKSFKDLAKRAWGITKKHGPKVVKAAAKKYGDAYDKVVDVTADKLISNIPGLKKLPDKWKKRFASAMMMTAAGALGGGLGVLAVRGGKMAADAANMGPFLKKAQEVQSKIPEEKLEQMKQEKTQETLAVFDKIAAKYGLA